MYTLINVALDHRYELKRRQAAALEMEPTVAGERLRLGAKRTLTDSQFKADEQRISKYEKQGVLIVRRTPDASSVTAPSPKTEAAASVAPAPTEDPKPEPVSKVQEVSEPAVPAPAVTAVTASSEPEIPVYVPPSKKIKK